MTAAPPPADRDRPTPTIFEALAAAQQAAAPATSFEPPGPSATVFEAAGSPPSGTVFETAPPAAAGGASTWMRINLPPELATHYVPLRALNVSAGQADLIVCQDRASGAEIVVKLYRYSDQLDREVLARLYQADPAHVVRLIDHGETHGVPWEVQEYCPYGTLADLCHQLGGRIPLDQMPHIVRELAQALHHIHTLGITHRDFKPQNVLVRTLQPELDLVLTDFGVARTQFGLTQFTAIKATFAWAAPEVHEGVQKAPVDWWALGAVIFELLTGRHLLAGPDGQLLPDVRLRPIVMRGLYTTTDLEPGRWRDLVDGLLSHNPSQRWNYEQVAAWLDGANPEVHRTVPASGLAGAGTAAGTVAGAPGTAPIDGGGIKFVFNGHPVATGPELAAAMRRDWPVAEELLDGPPDPSLEQWLSATPAGSRALEELHLETTPGARLVRLQGALDPDGTTEFRGHRLDDATLSDAITVASDWRPDGPPGAEQAANWLMAVRDQRIMRALAGMRTTSQDLGERLGLADLRLDEWHQQTLHVLRTVPDAKLASLAETRERALMAQFFAIALGAQPAESLISDLRRSIERRNVTGAFWLEGLALTALRVSEDPPASATLGVSDAARKAGFGGPGSLGGRGGVAAGTRLGAGGGVGGIGALGLLAATAVLTEAVSADNAARELAEASRRRAEEETTRTEIAQTQAEMQQARRNYFAKRLRSRLPWRIGVGVVYAVVGGWVVATGGRDGGTLITQGSPLLAICLLGVGLITLVDWLLESPSGPARRALIAAGTLAAAAGWVAGANNAFVERADIWPGPLLLATGWILGDTVAFALRRLTVGRPTIDLSRWAKPGERPLETSRRAQEALRHAATARAWSWILVGAALFTAASGLFSDACGMACSASHDWALGLAAQQSTLPLDFLGLSAQPWALAGAAAAAWVAQLASPQLLQVRWWAGWLAFWCALALAVLVLVTGPDSPVNPAIGGLVGLWASSG
ncbi:MAG: protein kinase [Bifidobacteriaceae bacterium]|jgi:hypothetical protein|nr:protein kinase [Bifidobacteriaceae bacterium]